MKTKTAPRIEQIFRARSDRTRLRILNLLLGGELCVCDIVSVLSVPQPTASRHLAYLRKAGLVLTRNEGLWRYYRLSPPNTSFHKHLLSCLGTCTGIAPELSKDTKRLRSSGGLNCCQ